MAAGDLAQNNMKKHPTTEYSTDMTNLFNNIWKTGKHPETLITALVILLLKHSKDKEF